jgi:hypothetical protein
MRFSPELIAVAVAILIFYMRIAMLRGKKRRLERELALKRRKVKGRSKGVALPEKNSNRPPYGVTSWWLVGLGITLMLFGMTIYNKYWLTQYQTFWWVPITLGVLVFAFCFKVQLPEAEE